MEDAGIFSTCYHGVAMVILCLGSISSMGVAVSWRCHGAIVAEQWRCSGVAVLYYTPMYYIVIDAFNVIFHFQLIIFHRFIF